MPRKLISFITPTRRFDELRAAFDSAEATVSDPSCMEWLVKFDTDQPGAQEFIEAEQKKRPFSIRAFITPRLEGVFSIWVGMEQLFFESDPETYFVMLATDEVRFQTKHWDKILRERYIGYYPDDVFRLRISSTKLLNYTSHYECTFMPESFPIYTRRWLELTEGTGDCWGSDGFQQCVAYHLWLGPGSLFGHSSYLNYYRENSLQRDVPVFDIAFGGMEFGVGVSPEDQKIRHRRNLQEWRRLTTHATQERFSYLARRIFAYTWAYKNGYREFSLVPDTLRKTVLVQDVEGSLLCEVPYGVPRLVVYAQNLLREIMLMPRHQFSLHLAPYWRYLKARFRKPRIPLPPKPRQKGLRRVLKVPYLICRELAEFCTALFAFAVAKVLNILRQIYSLVAQCFSRAGSLFYRVLYALGASQMLRSMPRWINRIADRVNYRRFRAELQEAARHEVVAPPPIPLPLADLPPKKKRQLMVQRVRYSLTVPIHMFFKIIDIIGVAPPPGLSVFYSFRPDMAPRVRLPTPGELVEARTILERREQAITRLRHKRFKVETEADGMERRSAV